MAEEFALASRARHAALRERWEARRAIKGEDDESAEVFWASFGAEREAVKKAAAAATVVEKEAVASLEARAKALSEQVRVAAAWLPAYDVKRATREAKEVEAAIEKVRKAVAPSRPKKFGFKKKLEAAKPSKQQQPVTATRPIEVGERVGFFGERGRVLTWEVRDAELELEDLVDCVVIASARLSALRVRNVEGCDIYCGGIMGPAYVANTRRSRVWFVARQLRVHDTCDSEFFVATATGPVIEDATSIRFGKYGARWEDESLAGVGDVPVVANAWRDVQDFKWLKPTPSPNWALLTEKDTPHHHEPLPESARADAKRLGLSFHQ
ncbi:hypothetical protein CTAYLR_008868 [Chrysophaeum taylorii]|uniref:C-CAP/cofactor C-like domain-containing protein n=1 Tax=Chrysophaeum taylorii TaxID=2483200 RepID=A0AAD7XF90_9STRA|nr:hypothetical protein CTAYLR_008868 [Chrysophaeum taylorii]